MIEIASGNTHFSSYVAHGHWMVAQTYTDVYQLRREHAKARSCFLLYQSRQQKKNSETDHRTLTIHHPPIIENRIVLWILKGEGKWLR